MVDHVYERRKLALIRAPDARELPAGIAIVQRDQAAIRKKRKECADIATNRRFLVCSIDEHQAKSDFARREFLRGFLRRHDERLNSTFDARPGEVPTKSRERAALFVENEAMTPLVAAYVMVDRPEPGVFDPGIDQRTRQDDRGAPLPGANLRYVSVPARITDRSVESAEFVLRRPALNRPGPEHRRFTFPTTDAEYPRAHTPTEITELGLERSGHVFRLPPCARGLNSAPGPVGVPSSLASPALERLS